MELNYFGYGRNICMTWEHLDEKCKLEREITQVENEIPSGASIKPLGPWSWWLTHFDNHFSQLFLLEPHGFKHI